MAGRLRYLVGALTVGLVIGAGAGGQHLPRPRCADLRRRPDHRHRLGAGGGRLDRGGRADRLESDPDQFVADRVREGSDHLKLMIDDGSLFGLEVPTLSPEQVRAVITAAHRRGEYHLGDRVRVRTGFRADLLLVNGDPTADIDAVRDIAVIWKNGYPVDRTVR